MSNNQNIFFGTCINNIDPMMLGRIRVEPIGVRINAMDKGYNGFNPDSTNPNNDGPWSNKDPYIYLPLLPYFVNQVPQLGEKVMLFYFNNDDTTTKNKFYMISIFSSPTTIGFEDNRSSNTNLNFGAVNSKQKFPKIKNNDGTYVNKNYSGVFPEPLDISFNGRDTSDIILKKNELLLRAGKHKPFSSGQIPVFDDNRAYLQLSKYFSKTVYGNVDSYNKLIENQSKIKYLIEYDIENPENPFSAFTATVYVYSLNTNDNSYLTLASNFNIKTNIDTTGSTISNLIKVINLPFGLSFENVSLEINKILRSVITSPSDILNLNNNNQYPFYYRPSSKIVKLINNPNASDLLSISNMTYLMSLIKVGSTDITSGYGLIMDNKLTPYRPYNIKKEVFVPSKSVPIENTVSLMGASQVYLLSHDSSIPGKDKINLNDTVYGIGQPIILDNIEPNTSSMVRGEELLELLQLIVNFCVTHVHPYPLMIPCAKTTSGLSTDKLLRKMQEAYIKILNNNIRIN